MKAEIEREIGMDDIRRQLHNEAVMDEVKRLEREVRGEAGNGAKHAEAATPDSVALGGSHPDASTAPAAPAAPTSHAPTRV
jgi:sec-independent protein translocase protein TatB